MCGVYWNLHNVGSILSEIEAKTDTNAAGGEFQNY